MRGISGFWARRVEGGGWRVEGGAWALPTPGIVNIDTKTHQRFYSKHRWHQQSSICHTLRFPIAIAQTHITSSSCRTRCGTLPLASFVSLLPPSITTSSVAVTLHAIVLFAAAIMVAYAPMPRLAVHCGGSITSICKSPRFDCMQFLAAMTSSISATVPACRHSRCECYFSIMKLRLKVVYTLGECNNLVGFLVLLPCDIVDHFSVNARGADAIGFLRPAIGVGVIVKSERLSIFMKDRHCKLFLIQLVCFIRYPLLLPPTISRMEYSDDRDPDTKLSDDHPLCRCWYRDQLHQPCTPFYQWYRFMHRPFWDWDGHVCPCGKAFVIR